MPEVLALEMLIYYSGRQAHKSLVTKQHGGCDVGGDQCGGLGGRKP